MLFNDFGDKFTIIDRDGEKVEEVTLSEVMVDVDAKKNISVFVGTKQVFEDFNNEDLVKIRDVQFKTDDEDKKVA